MSRLEKHNCPHCLVSWGFLILPTVSALDFFEGKYSPSAYHIPRGSPFPIKQDQVGLFYNCPKASIQQAVIYRFGRDSFHTVFIYFSRPWAGVGQPLDSTRDLEPCNLYHSTKMLQGLFDREKKEKEQIKQEVDGKRAISFAFQSPIDLPFRSRKS